MGENFLQQRNRKGGNIIKEEEETSQKAIKHSEYADFTWILIQTHMPAAQKCSTDRC